VLWLGRDEAEHDRNRAAHAPHVEGAEAEAASLGYRLVDFVPLRDGMRFARFRRILETRGIRALLVIPPPYPTDLADLDFSGLACATIGYALERPVLHRINPLFLEGVRMALDEAWNAGYRRPALLATEGVSRRVSDQIKAGFVLERELGRWQSPLPILSFEQKPDGSAPRGILGWIKKHRIDCLLAHDWNGSMRFMLRALGHEIPGPIGYVDLERNVPERGIAGLEVKYEALGSWAIKSIVSQIHRNEGGIPEEPLEIGIHCSWHPAASLPPKKDLPRAAPQRRGRFASGVPRS